VQPPQEVLLWDTCRSSDHVTCRASNMATTLSKMKRTAAAYSRDWRFWMHRWVSHSMKRNHFLPQKVNTDHIQRYSNDMNFPPLDWISKDGHKAAFAKLCCECVREMWIGVPWKNRENQTNHRFFYSITFTTSDYSLRYCSYKKVLVTIRFLYADCHLTNVGAQNTCSVNIYEVKKCSVKKSLGKTITENSKIRHTRAGRGITW